LTQIVTYTLPEVVDPNGEIASIAIITTLPSYITWNAVTKTFTIQPDSAS